MIKSLVHPAQSLKSNKTSTPIYLPGLNGLRAIAAIAVVLSHITLELNSFGLNNKIFGTDLNGNAKGLSLAANGVTIFFTLSGFLITFLLLKEKELGKIKIKEFYLRRLLRIWPLYYLYFFACIIIIISTGLTFAEKSIPFYILLSANIPFIIGTSLPFLAHYWSLGVEEQFYLFFPQIAKYSNKRLLVLAIIIICCFLILKALFWVLREKYGISMPLTIISVTRFHIMLIGVVGAYYYYYKNPLFLAITTHKITQLISWGCILLITIDKFHIASVIDGEIISVISLFIIIGQITKKNRIINLENNVCDFIGKISYGIYVIHPLLIFFYARLLGKFKTDVGINYIIVYFLILATTLITAYFSYEYYEKLFLKLKSRYAVIKSSNTRNAKHHS